MLFPRHLATQNNFTDLILHQKVKADISEFLNASYQQVGKNKAATDVPVKRRHKVMDDHGKKPGNSSKSCKK